jgi:predicted dehydrogenase
MSTASRPAARRTLVVAGTGSIGTRHIDNLRALLYRDLVAYSGRPEAGEGEPARDLQALLSERPRAVLVCNPTAFHVSTALAAARAGAHLFLEKPLSHDLEGVAALEAEVAARGLVVLVGFQYRFHPGLRKVREWLGTGALGAVVSVRVCWGEHLPSWHPGEDYRRSYSARRDLGGGAILTLCHPFDYLRWLLGEVRAVCAEAAQRSGLELDVEDTAIVLLRFVSGALGVVSLDYVQRPRRHELEILGTTGTVRWSEAEGTAELRRPGAARQLFRPPAGFQRNTMFKDEMRHFLACLAGAESPQCPLADGIEALRIAVAARRSMAEGRSVALSEVRP